MLVTNAFEGAFDDVERLVPLDLAEAVAVAQERLDEAIDLAVSLADAADALIAQAVAS